MPKNIIICCDGTGNQFCDNNTNVIKLYQLAHRGNPDEQIAYYDPGVGTGGWDYDGKDAITDGATGEGLQKNVEDAYHYLMHRYAEGDNIYLFGFSRGAFTVRSLAGMLHKCGLLYRDMDNMISYASKMYNTADNDKTAADFKATFSRRCPVHFIGVWDTVASLTLNAGKRFHNASLNPEVKYGYHAVALDEIRNDFPPSLWKDRDNVEQVWFAGVHSDVGGWYSDARLSNIALKWMAEKASERGMKLDEAKVAALECDPQGMQHDSHSGIFWSLMGKHIRELPAGAKVHESVHERLGKEIAIGDDKSEEQDKKRYETEATLNGEKLTADGQVEVEWVR